MNTAAILCIFTGGNNCEEKGKKGKEDNVRFNEILNNIDSVRKSIDKSQNPKVDGMDSLDRKSVV